jgi:hypothetical protein
MTATMTMTIMTGTATITIVTEHKTVGLNGRRVHLGPALHAGTLAITPCFAPSRSPVPIDRDLIDTALVVAPTPQAR